MKPYSARVSGDGEVVLVVDEKARTVELSSGELSEKVLLPLSRSEALALSEELAQAARGEGPVLLQDL